MSNTTFQTQWREIAARWKLRVETPFVVDLSLGSITVPVLLRDFGAANGMLLVTDYNMIAPYADELVALGFGYSCLAEPTARYDPGADDESLRDMLEDWTWTGTVSAPMPFRDPAS